MTNNGIERPHNAQAALDVFQKEPPPADNPLVGRPDVVCTPHLGASTREAQEGVALEIAEAVVAALNVRFLRVYSISAREDKVVSRSTGRLHMRQAR